ncbi:MAG: Transcriptional regulatory protein sin3 [Thelocarpon superellum]|nr:MAG: Transcriptional regulatory protein sin3 [Thelocarpon superellum]
MGPYYTSSQSSSHGLPTIAGLTQSSPQPAHGSPSHPPPPGPGAAMHQAAPPGPGYALPGLSQAMPHPPLHASVALDREREMRERDARDREARDRQRHQEEAAQRDAEQREREREMQERDREQRERERERQHREPAQNHAGSLPIHQPVASKVPTAIHGPGGLLSGIGAGAGVAPGPSTGALGGPPGNAPSNLFGGPLQSTEGPPHVLHQVSAAGPPPPHTSHQPPPPPPGHPTVPFTGGPTVHQMGVPQGQQPILNDALSYLDQVKVQFVDQPDVYNRFLDIMKDFKSQAIDTPGVIERVSTLFAGHPNLIQGFNTFLPPGYRIECGSGDDPNAIRVTTPMGTTVSSMGAGLRPPSTAANGVPGPNGVGGPPHPGAYYEQISRNANGSWAPPPPTHGGPGFDGTSPNGRPGAGPVFGQASGASHGHGPSAPMDPHGPRDHAAAANAAAMAQHQQEQRGVSHLQNAITVANGAPTRAGPMQTSPSGGGAPMGGPSGSSVNGGAGSGGGAGGNSGGVMQPGIQAGLEKRGPVEFNHAISYVNKIKNRFASQPEIYKQFLEILQTYQRESKPIQDVYAQVTHLFNSAPDLLEDFKQFLPESAAHAKEQAAAKQAAEDAAMLSNVRGEPTYLSGLNGAPPAPGPHRSEIKMPPVGNFAPPPSAGKESKKRQRTTAGPIAGTVPASVPPTAVTPEAFANLPGPRGPGLPATVVNKRSKLQHTKAALADVPVVSPTLTPAQPEPLPPTTTAGATTEEIAFFDRVKKFIGNKQTMNEFLKLCNLFSQDLIDKNVLVNKVATFIGANPELMSWFKRFVGYDGKDEVIENRPRPASGRVTLSNCRGYGPSYRLLPKRPQGNYVPLASLDEQRVKHWQKATGADQGICFYQERLKQCSGRDEMCYEVLNDDWASHPTWASEDSGFVAHRKNTYEEALHRIEEERHDYDFNIEANLRTMQLLEPICQQIQQMSEEERMTFTLPPGIGGQSTAIYQRVIKKLYGRDKGQRVIDDLFVRPCGVAPLLLARLKQKDEEWKQSQREWEKVWREQTQKMFWKSLDHMGIHAKVTDKKQFTQKTLINEIQTKLEEQRRQREVPRSQVPKHQFENVFDDSGVVLDATRLLLVFAEHTSNHNAADRQRIELVLRDFVPRFFGFAADLLDEGVSPGSGRAGSGPDDDAEETTVESAGSSNGRGRRGGHARKTDLRRGVLDRTRASKSAGRPGTDAEAETTESKESTPDVGAAVDDELDGVGGDAVADDTTEHSGVAAAAADPNEDNWTQHPTAGAKRKSRPPTREILPNEPFRRESYSLYCNANVYSFMRMFQILYDRLLQIKRYEPRVAEDVRRAKMFKPAHDLKVVDKRPEDFFRQTGPQAHYYPQVLEMCQELIEQQIDVAQFEEVLRRFYLECGWQLYALEKLLGAVARYALSLMSNEAKDKSADILQLFYRDREREQTTHQHEINYRKQVEKLIKDGDVFRIVYNQATADTTIQLLQKGDTTFDEDTMSAEARWSYYTASYIKIEPTEGVPLDTQFNMPFLRRSMGAHKELDESETSERAIPYAYENGLELRICVNSYKILWEPDTQDWFVHAEETREAAEAGETAEAGEAGEEAEATGEERAVTLTRAHERREAAFAELVAHPTWMKDVGAEVVTSSQHAYADLAGTDRGDVDQVMSEAAATTTATTEAVAVLAKATTTTEDQEMTLA